MGHVYQHARLDNCRVSCSELYPVVFLYPSASPADRRAAPRHGSRRAQWQHLGSLVACIDFPAISPDEGALAYRAWATQEWLLSQAHGLLYGRLHCMVLQGRQSA